MQAKDRSGTIRRVNVGGVEIRVRDSGGPGLPVLMTHGIGGSLELWDRQFDAVAPGLRLLAWDLPSHGLSEAAEGDTDLEGIARTAWQMLDTLGVGPAILVGNSLGGAVSLRMAAQAPARVRGLLLAASACLGRETMLPFRLMTLPVLGELMTRPGPVAVQQQIRAIVHDTAAITPDLQAVIERNVGRPGGAGHFLRLLRGLTNLRGQRAAVLARSRGILTGLRMPVCFVHGELDTVLPAAHSRAAHALVPGADLAVLEGCGHTPQLEQPQRFAALLDGVIQRAAA
jgi:pimeloyl-ACP methyl ester carboxylesterase